MLRTQGAEGLSEVARASKRVDDLSAWCRALVETGDWKAVLVAYDEAADLVTDTAYARTVFLDDDFAAAAKLLAAAPGLGWSAGYHPGHLLFPLFVSLL